MQGAIVTRIGEGLTAFRGRNETKINGFDESNPYGQGLGMGFCFFIFFKEIK